MCSDLEVEKKKRTVLQNIIFYFISILPTLKYKWNQWRTAQGIGLEGTKIEEEYGKYQCELRILSRHRTIRIGDKDPGGEKGRSVLTDALFIYPSDDFFFLYSLFLIKFTRSPN